MKYKDAKKLQIGDEIIIRTTKQSVKVVKTTQERSMNMFIRNVILIECDDGNTYCHRNVDLKELENG